MTSFPISELYKLSLGSLLPYKGLSKVLKTFRMVYLLWWFSFPENTPISLSYILSVCFPTTAAPCKYLPILSKKLNKLEIKNRMAVYFPPLNTTFKLIICAKVTVSFSTENVVGSTM